MSRQAEELLERTSAGAAPQDDRLFATRQRSVEIASPLSAEDMAAQASDDASPTKWHLAHTTWFFETFLLEPHLPGYRHFDDDFGFLFNSYYEGAGPRHPRPSRGLLTRPSAARVAAYREHVDEALAELLDTMSGDRDEIARLVEIGINHEQQHQELMLTDILALFARSPLRPTYVRRPSAPAGAAEGSIDPVRWIAHPGGIESIGSDGAGYAWDNELPRHEVLLAPYLVADRLVTNGEWLAFIEAGAYRDPLLWLSDGWATVMRENWFAPLYWERRDGEWITMTLHGLQPIEPRLPVAHISYYEADAFARWAGHRLPTELEWEAAAAPASTAVATHRNLMPAPASEPTVDAALRQAFGEVWQWTASAYLAYPGYRPPRGTIGEYNGKFMVNQHVLRGSSFATPGGHSRVTYRNFFHPHQRWQFTGLRLAQGADRC